MNTKEKERLQILMQCSVLDSELNEADYTSITSAATRLLKVNRLYFSSFFIFIFLSFDLVRELDFWS